MLAELAGELVLLVFVIFIDLTFLFNRFNKGHVVELSKAIYSRFLITKMLHYSTKEQQEQIIKEFYGRV